MIIALMLAGYAAAKFNQDKTDTGRDEHLLAPPETAHEPATSVDEDADCVLGADAWVAFPPARPAW